MNKTTALRYGVGFGRLGFSVSPVAVQPAAKCPTLTFLPSALGTLAAKRLLMFWDSVIEGFVILLNFKVWLLIAVYAIVTILFHNAFMNKLITTYDPSKIAKSGMVFMIRKSLIDTLLIVIIVVFIAPIIFGDSKLNSIENVWKGIIPILVVSAIITGIRVIFASFNSFKDAFAEGGGYGTSFICMTLILIMSNASLDTFITVKDPQNIQSPSFLLGAGLFLITLPMIWLFIFIFGIIVQSMEEQTKEFILKGVLLSSGLIFGIVFMRMYGAAVVDLNKAPTEVSKSITDKDGINWEQRIENDAATICYLINMSSATTDIDNIKMQSEEFSQKIKDYPKNKQDTLKRIAKTYIRYSQQAILDLRGYCDSLANGFNADPKYWGVKTKLISDSLERYSLPASVMSNPQLDSLAIELRMKSGFGEMQEVRSVRDNLKNRYPFIANVLADSYYRIFREKYE
jgi:hypothetical protein